MKLVRITNYKLEVEDELLLLKPFKELYKKDKTKDKIGFMEFLTIVYFVYDPRSDYSYIIDEEERLKEVCETNGIDKKSFSGLESQCIELYKQLTTTVSSVLLKSTKTAIHKVSKFLDDVDLTAVDDKGKPCYTINSITSAIKQIPSLAKDVMEAEKAVNKEILEQGRARGGNNKKLMEDGITL